MIEDVLCFTDAFVSWSAAGLFTEDVTKNWAAPQSLFYKVSRVFPLVPFPCAPDKEAASRPGSIAGAPL